MARGLIVGCGCRGRELGGRLAAGGWLVRGTTRDGSRVDAIAAAGIEPAVADPDLLGSILDQIADVALVFWLLGSASGAPKALDAIHGPRLERLLEELVDTPVRGFVYEAAGNAGNGRLAGGAEIVRAAAKRWRIPVEIVAEPPEDPATWTQGMVAAASRLVPM